MPIRNQIEAIVNSMLVVDPVAPATEPTAPAFLYGTAKELNQFADNAVFPCVFMYAQQLIELNAGANGSVNNTISIFLAFLFKTEFDQFSADDEVLVNTALKWSNIFVVKANSYRENGRRYFRVKVGQKGQFKPFYNRIENDVNVSGGTLSITLETMYDENLSAY